MNWIETTWMLLAGMSLALAMVQLVAWLQRREAHEHLVYAAFVLAAAAGAVFEARLLMSQTTVEYAANLRLAHAAFGTALIFMSWFVHLRFRAGRTWLLYAATALRLFLLATLVVSTTTITFRDVHVRQVLMPGGVTVAAPMGAFNPLQVVAHLNLLLLLAYFIDALRELRRRGDREEYRRGLRICGSLIVYVLVGGGLAVLVTYNLLALPFLVTPVLLIPILVLSYELGADLTRARVAALELGRSESLLRENQQHWELAGQIAGIAPWSWTASTGELHLSPKAREMFALPGEGPSRIEDWVAHIHPDDVERVRRDVQRTLASERRFERNYRLLTPLGHVRWITSRGQVDRDAEGAAVSMRAVSFDVTEMRQVDAMFRAALEAAPNAIFLVDDAGQIQLANARATRLFGYDNEELLQMPLERLVPDWVHRPERRRRNGAPPRGVERRARARELAAKRRDGAAVQVELELRPLDAGLVLASVSDITERLQSEHESAQQRTELAHLSRVAMLGEMSASLAHELNQPLTAIVSNAQAALRFLEGGAEHHWEVKESLDDIAASGARAGDVIRRLRVMLKKEEAQRLDLDVNQMICEVLQLYRSDLINRGVSVHLSLDPDLPPVLGDRVQLQQVLLNLVINACDAMGEVAGERYMCVCSRRMGAGEVEFAVCDVGPGIAPERLDRVFDPFVSSKPSGLGLGLSVCKTIVKAHGGRIWATKREGVGQGASLRVALPAVAGQTAPRSEAAELDGT